MKDSRMPRQQDVQRHKNRSKTAPPSSTAEDEQEEISFHKMHAMDYVLRREVIKRIRLENEADWYLFMLKEKFDNAIDFLWKYYPAAPIEYKLVTADIVLDTDKKLFRCTITNSNGNNKPAFPNLSNILDFNMTYGTKQYDYKITRGTLGDALKQLASLPYTLMKEDQLEQQIGDAEDEQQWNYPMAFRFNGKEYEAVLNVDKMNSTIKAPPVLTKHIGVASATHTEVRNIWPIIDKVRNPANKVNYLDAKKIIAYCYRYFIFTTDILFEVKISEAGQKPVIISVPATTANPISSKWVNAPSIYYYSLDDFTNRLYAVHDKNKTTVYQFVKEFREWNQVSKKDVHDLDMPISQFLQDQTTRTQKIKSLYLKVRTQGKILKSPDRLSLPYTVKDERKKALASRLQDIFKHKLDESKAAYEILHGVVEEKDTASGQLVRYPYAFEVIAMPYDEDIIREADSPDEYKSIFVAGAINYSVSPEHNFFQGSYYWYDKKKDKHLDANFIQDILEQYDFIFRTYETNKQRTKIPCMLAANLISPKLTYKSEGKSDVDMTPFQDTVTQVIAKIARQKQIKTFKSAGIDTKDTIDARLSSYQRNLKAEERRKAKERKEKKTTILDVVKMIILPRIEQFKRGEEFIEKDTQDSIWYLALPLFSQYKVKFHHTKSRPGVKRYISEICEANGVTREDIGIIAGAWATMYFDGKFSAVSFADVESLAMNGTDIIFIEKMGMVEAIKDHADRYGIALVNSHGHLTEYAKDLSTAAIDSGAHVAVVTDYDVPGLVIASKLDPSIPWLGIDKRTIEHFNMPLPNPETGEYPAGEQRMVAVPYVANSKPISKEELYKLQQTDPRFSTARVDIDWLWQKTETYTNEKGKKKTRIRGNKIEIDAVKKDQGSEGLWNYIMKLLGKEYPRRDYTRVISNYLDIPTPSAKEFSLPKVVSNVRSFINKRAESITKDRRIKIEEELKDYEGFLEVGDKKSKIQSELLDIVNNDQIIKDVSAALSSVADSVEEIIIEAVVSAIKKLDEQKGYGVMKALEGSQK